MRAPKEHEEEVHSATNYYATHYYVGNADLRTVDGDACEEDANGEFENRGSRDVD